jgi:hypothetical protein
MGLEAKAIASILSHQNTGGSWRETCNSLSNIRSHESSAGSSGDDYETTFNLGAKS